MSDFVRDPVQQSAGAERSGFARRVLERVATSVGSIGLIGLGIGFAAEGLKTGDVGAVYDGLGVVGGTLAFATATEAYVTYRQS